MGVLSEMLLSPADIVVDTREASKNKDIVEELKRRGLKVAVTALNVGDYYLVGTERVRGILVERKTVTDLLNSVRDNRIWEQAKLLVKAAEEDGLIPMIVLEGWLGAIEKYTKWNMGAALRILDEIILDWGIPVLNTPNRRATAAWLAAKAKSLGSLQEKRVARMRVEKKPMTLNERILYVAEGIVGPTLARRLLRKFRTLRRIANASMTELMSVEGIGEKRAKEIYAIFNTEWQEP
ncbi:MAG: ERCC4 domain-containing protein [Thermoproteota archaeon]